MNHKKEKSSTGSICSWIHHQHQQRHPFCCVHLQINYEIHILEFGKCTNKFNRIDQFQKLRDISTLIEDVDSCPFLLQGKNQDFGTLMNNKEILEIERNSCLPAKIV